MGSVIKNLSGFDDYRTSREFYLIDLLGTSFIEQTKFNNLNDGIGILRSN